MSRGRRFLHGPLKDHLKTCPTHGVFFCWKSEAIPNMMAQVKGYVDVRICPVCMHLARLAVEYAKGNRRAS